MVVCLYAFAILFYQVCSCEVPAPRGPYYVDSKNVGAGHSGAECDPFSSLQQAIDKTETFSSGVIVIVGNSVSEVYHTGSLVIGGNIAIDLNEHCWELAATMAVSPHSHLIVQNGTMRAQNIQENSIEVGKGASLFIANCKIEGWQSVIFILSGALMCSECKFFDNMGGIVSFDDSGGDLEIVSSVIQNNRAGLGTVFKVSSLLTDSLLRVNITNTTIVNNIASIRGSVGFIDSSTFADSSLRSISISSCEIANNSGTNFAIVADSISFNITRSRIHDIERAFLLSLSSSLFYMANTTISVSSISTIRVVYLNGTIILEGVTITGVSAGPAVMLTNSFLDAPKAVVTLHNVQIDSVNSTGTSPGAIYVSGFTLIVSHLEISNIACFISCGFILVGSPLSLSHIKIHDIVGNFFLFAHIISSTGTLTDLEIYNGASLGLYVFGQTFCTLSISSVYMHDLTPNVQNVARQLYNLIFVHQFYSTVLFTEVLIRPPPQLVFVVQGSVSSETTFKGLVYPRLHAVQAYMSIMSTVTIEGLVLGVVEIESYFMVIGGILTVRDLSIAAGRFLLGMFTTQQGTSSGR